MKKFLGLLCGGAALLIFSSLMLGAAPRTQSIATTPPPSALSVDGPVADEHYAWRTVAIGGGGFITGLSVDDMGRSLVGRSDVHGAWLWEPRRDRWVLLSTADSMPDRKMQSGIDEGVYEITVAPSDGSRIYMAVKGAVYRSDDRGRHWSRPATSPFPEHLDPNATTRLYGPFMAVAPTDPDLITFGPPDGSFWISRDGARNWARVALPATERLQGLHAPRSPGIISWFRHGPRTEIWAMVAGRGMFRSQDLGRSFQPLFQPAEKAPKLLQHGTFAHDGSFFGTDPVGQAVWRYRDGAWADVSGALGLMRRELVAIAINPKDDSIFVFDIGGRTFRSNNGGTSWLPVYRSSRAGDKDPPWHRLSNQGYFATGAVLFDPVVTDRMWVAAGFGVFRAQAPGLADALVWESHSRGIEELVATDIAQTPGHAPMFAGWDFGIHVKSDLSAYSTTYGPRERVLIAAQQVATTPADPSFAVTNASDTRQNCCSEDGLSVLAGYTEDGGRNWTRFPSLPTPPGTRPDDPWRMAFGTIAVAANDTANIVWMPTNNRAPFYTKDKGKSWHQVHFPGEVLPLTGSHRLYTMTRKVLTADAKLPNTFYLVHSGNKDNPALTGFWHTRDGGATWEKVYAGEISPASAGSAKLRAVPGKTQHLFFTSAVRGPPDTRLRRTMDGGRSWQALDDVRDVDDLAFGKAARNANYPAIYVSGKVQGVYGIWRSIDNAGSWKQLTDFPAGRLDQVTSMAADPDVFGRVYLGYMGSGFMYGEPARCKATAEAPRDCTQPR